MALLTHHRLNMDATDSAGGHTSTPVNLSFAAGVFGSAGSFETSNSSIVVNDVPATSAEFSVSAWVYRTGPSSGNNGYSAVLNQSNDSYSTHRFSTFVKDSGEIAAWVWNGGAYSVNSGVFLPSNEWHHIVWTYDIHRRLSIYLDGVLIHREVVPNADINQKNATTKVHIGTFAGRGSYDWNGRLDDVRFYDHALSKREVRDLSQALVAHWRFDVDDPVAYDSSGQRMDATVEGATWVKDGVFGNGCFQFNGAGTADGSVPGDHITVDEDITKTDQGTRPRGCTYCFWLNVDPNAVNRMSLFYGSTTIRHIEILSQSRNFRTEASTQNGYSFGTGTFPDEVRGVWSHFAIVFSNEEPNRPVRWYQNGKLFHTGYMGNGNNPEGEHFSFSKIGRSTGNASFSYAKSFHGKMDDMRIYATPLSQQDINDIRANRASVGDEGTLHTPTIVQALRVRYIRDWLSGSTSNGGKHWNEVRALRDGVNLSLGKPVTCNGTGTRLTKVTDGNTNSSGYAYVSGVPDAWVQVDLGSIEEVDEIHVWHYDADGRTYYGTKTEVSEDGVTWFSVFDSEFSGTYQETPAGVVHRVAPRLVKTSPRGLYVPDVSEIGFAKHLIGWYPLLGDLKNRAGGDDAVGHNADPTPFGYRFDRNRPSWLEIGDYGLFNGNHSFSAFMIANTIDVGGTQPRDCLFNPLSEGYFAVMAFSGGYKVVHYDSNAVSKEIAVNHALGVPVHIGMTYDASSGVITGYLNGQPFGTMTVSSGTYRRGTVNYVGKDYWSGQREYNGVLSDLRIYDARLSDADAHDLYRSVFNGPSTIISQNRLYVKRKIREMAS